MSGPLFTKPTNRMLMVWAAAAALNVGAGVVVSLQPARASDLETMVRWTRAWLIEGQNIYAMSGWGVDYPPHAIVVLSPLVAPLPFGVTHLLWVAANVGFVLVTPYLAARSLRPHDPFRVVLLPVLMFMSWGGTRTLAQFTMASLACSMAAMVLADRRPAAAGMLLGAALMKPQVALPVFLWSLLTRRWKLAGTSSVIVGVLFAGYCVRASAQPLEVTVTWLKVLAVYHSGDAILSGLSELRPLLVDVFGRAINIDATAMLVGAILLAIVLAVGVWESRERRHVLFAAPPLAACWSLLTFYHLTYGFVVLLPALMLLALGDVQRSRIRVAVLWMLQLGMMVDVPGVVRRIGLMPEGGAAILDHADRAVVGAIFLGLMMVASRERHETTDPRPAR